VFNLTGSELVVILLLALVVLGPEKLPGAIRQAGRIYSELRKISNGFQKEFVSAIQEPAKEMRNLTDMLGSSLNEISSTPAEPGVDEAVIVKDQVPETDDPAAGLSSPEDPK
jgi:sec-independent protein translocase protein TatB